MDVEGIIGTGERDDSFQVAVRPTFLDGIAEGFDCLALPASCYVKIRSETPTIYLHQLIEKITAKNQIYSCAILVL